MVWRHSSLTQFLNSTRLIIMFTYLYRLPNDPSPNLLLPVGIDGMQRWRLRTRHNYIVGYRRLSDGSNHSCLLDGSPNGRHKTLLYHLPRSHDGRTWRDYSHLIGLYGRPDRLNGRGGPRYRVDYVGWRGTDTIYAELLRG